MQLNMDEVNKILSSVSFPASKDDLVSEAKEENASKEVVDAIEKLPDQEYKDMTEVMDHLKTMG